MRLSQLMMLLGGKFSENDYSYTGSSAWVDEGLGDWHINFTTSGVLTLNKAVKADLYLLGGGQSGASRNTWGGGYHEDTYCAGGKGGQGGFISTPTGVVLLPGSYTVTIGEGGSQGDLRTGGATVFGSFSAPGGGSGATGYFGGASGGAAGYGRGTNTPYAGGIGANSTVYDFDGVNRGGGGSGGYSWKAPWTSGSTSYNWVSSGGGSQGGGHAMTGNGAGQGAVEALANYGGGGYGYSSSGGGSQGGSGFAQIRNAR